MNKSYLLAGLLGTAYAAWLSTDAGQDWIDANTTAGVAIGVGGVLATLKLTQSDAAWRATVGGFVAAGLPLVIRGVIHKLS